LRPQNGLLQQHAGNICHNLSPSWAICNL
jgi:hypothetical protein